ncbi:restriction endonuclease subunit S [Limosilactobacillus reuteri]|uniref:restriction endonuclease subunit S n=2 Tax=Limosilactobacillus reuteri TaxID=1598 RepID=UPI001E65DA91|nr:restriction endonuclease subunit S [Limosilactobacillus reuteri]MCC4504366.1 restriction endonuclease subunit S [Limosilactobacillus reuteri]
MDKKPEKLVPEVRFKGFTDDWEQRELGDITNYIKGYAFKSASYQAKGNVLLIRASDLSSGTLAFLPDKKYLPSQFLETFKRYKLNQGDIVITTVGSKSTMKSSAVGRPIYINSNKPYLLNQNLVKITVNDSINSFYLYNQLLKSKYKYFVSTIERGNANQANITIHDLWKYKAFLTSELEEKQIGHLLLKLNQLFYLQQRKLEQLNLLQKYVKEKTLPSQKKLPKLRFLNTPYNTYKFSELFKKSTKKNDGQILQNHVISVASMRWGKLPKSSSEAYMKTYFIFNKGDIAYEGNRSKRYSFGRFVANDLGNGIVSHVFSVFNSKINFNLEFLKNYINSEQVMRDPLRMSTSRTTMMTNLVLKDIAKQTLMIPSKNEQDLLGSLYKITQSMIELNEKQQQELIYLKKYLLQKLFI